MPSQKRALADSTPAPKSKKTKLNKTTTTGESNAAPTSALTEENIDFPRGGGTSFTPLEVKSLRAEATREANAELFKDAQQQKKAKSVKRRKSQTLGDKVDPAAKHSGKLRIEHLNYKRMYIGQKIYGQIVSIHPLALVVSLPNQLFGHVPITQISEQYTTALEKMDDSEEESGSEAEEDERVPDLGEMFAVGQFVRAVVNTVHTVGTTADASGLGKSRDETARASRRVELSLIPEKVNGGIPKADLKPGFVLTGAVRAIEDHGYTLELGVPEISGFLSFKDAQKGKLSGSAKLKVGQLIEANVSKLKSRVCNLTLDSLHSASLTDVVNATSLLPGALVQCLVTDVRPEGLVAQVLGFFDGTIDEFQLPANHTTKLGSKIKARMIYSIESSPPKYALSLAEHVVRPQHLTKTDTPTLESSYPLGKVLDDAKVIRCDPERGLVLSIDGTQQGFVHISHVSDEHTPLLSSNSGHWKVGTLHRARVTGYFAFDNLLQLSLKPSVIEQKFLQVSDVKIGDKVKGTVKKLTDIGLFISLSGYIDGIVKPLHYADIKLKNPSKKFKEGAPINCRVLAVEPERKRVLLSCKKSLLDSTLPMITSFEDAKPGVTTHGVVIKVLEKQVVVSFFNGLKAFIPSRELSDVPLSKASEQFSEGRVVKVKILSADPENDRIIGSIRQTSSTSRPEVVDVNLVQIGDIVGGVVKALHKDNALLTLKPSGVQALISLKNIANNRSVPLVQLSSQLQVSDQLEDLVVVSRNSEKGIVIVAHKPKAKEALPNRQNISFETVEIGQVVAGRVTKHIPAGALIKFTGQLGGILHSTDITDDFCASKELLPMVGSVINAAVVAKDEEKKRLVLSTRPSRMEPSKATNITDAEVNDRSELFVGKTVQGFVKTVADHGLFVTIGRNIDARVQIRELFDAYVKDWQPQFKVNQVVKGRVLKVDQDSKQVELTFKTGVLPASTLELSDIPEGTIVKGVIKRIEPYGIFIEIENSKITGLCHKSELSDNEVADVDAALNHFHAGDRIKAAVVSVKGKKVNLSLKPSLIGENLESEDSEDEDQEMSDGTDNRDLGAGEDEDDDAHPEQSSDDDDDGQAMDIDLTIPTFVQGASKNITVTTSNPPLQVRSGFDWFDSQEQNDNISASEASDDDSEAGESKEQPSKKKKRKVIEHDLTAQMHTKLPDSVADFERVLLGSPDSSYVWIQYMSFQIQLFEIDKARAIAHRALQTINFREEQEKMNVWIALLNLENTYGTDETLDSTFKEAARSNDSKTIHLRLASILEQSGKVEKAVEHYTKTCKKFGHSSKVWVLFAECRFRQGDVEAARQLLPRSLQSLEKRKHLKTVAKFAQLEYKMGEPERARTIFEGIVESHPKRWDMWSIYMDMEATQGDIQSLRNLFNRVLAGKLTSYKAKSFFKKWLALEQQIGDEAGEAQVKQKAIEWTASHSKVD